MGYDAGGYLRDISAEELAKHNKADDFWMVVDNEVFDLTNYWRKHPGGGLILSGAGSDGSVMFHSYHIRKKAAARAVKNSMKIGVFIGPTSPVMGKFYDECSDAVAKRLKGLPTYPWQAQAAFLGDIAFEISVLYYSWYNLNIDSSLLLTFLLWFAVFFCCHRRISQYSHAICHMQMFGPWGSYFAELLILFSPNTTIIGYVGANNSNPRTLINEHRSVSEFEFGDWFYNRGPYEHQAIHHVKGADMDHDRCHFVMRGRNTNLFRMSPHFEWEPQHAMQTKPYIWWLVEILSLSTQVYGAITSRLKMIQLLWALEEYDRLAASSISLMWSLPLLRFWTLPLRMGWCGVLVWFLSNIVAAICIPQLRLMWAQHTWDVSVDESVSNTDWGMYNLLNSISFQPSTWDMITRPMLWFGNGACPATLSYHLEHTLFPGLCYRYLPLIASTIEKVAEKHGLKYNKIVSERKLKEAFTSYCKKYSVDNFIGKPKVKAVRRKNPLIYEKPKYTCAGGTTKEHQQ